MGTYIDRVPTKACLVVPTYEAVGVVVDGEPFGVEFLARFPMATSTSSYTLGKFSNAAYTAVGAGGVEPWSAFATYSAGDRAYVADTGFIYVAARDDSEGDHHPAKYIEPDETGSVYWVEDGVIESHSIFDASTVTDFSVTGKSVRITIPIGDTYVYSGTPPITNYPQMIALMGIRGLGETTKVFVQIVARSRKRLVDVFSEPENKCYAYSRALIDSFEVDCTYRDRICFDTSYTLPENWGDLFSEPVEEEVSIFWTINDTIDAEIYIETFDALHSSIPSSYDPCGTATRQMPAIRARKLSIGACITGQKKELGLTEFGMKLGRSTIREEEQSYLKRRTVKKAVETIECSVVVEGQEEHLRADHFFRLASETSHIIHAGTPAFDWRFGFGVLDGGMPIEHPSLNKMSVTGTCAAFFATDPLITIKRPLGWS
ncbi:MAG: hypothetical protein JXK05_04070 [Campylobacterales bacterium]|nr:hypothetical protein [Campylobacterales bacterium]